MSKRRSCSPALLFFLLLFLIGVLILLYGIPILAAATFGSPSDQLSTFQRATYGLKLLIRSSDLTVPFSAGGVEQDFSIAPGESIQSISSRLESNGLIANGDAFSTYLVWTGLDTYIQTGTYLLSPAQTGLEIADMLGSFSMTEVTFVVLPGWRLEEAAASLMTSGLDIAPAEFVSHALTPINAPDFVPVGASLEGFLAPGSYLLPRTTSCDQLLEILLQGFSSELANQLREGFSRNNLTIYQAVTLASIIEREAIVEEEMPMIASVFYNRLAIGMALQSDPTVQYALGYNSAQATWWTNPLSAQDLQVGSTYNTYLYPGLPPGPISNPSLEALQAVAEPATSDYFFFQARCDGSGLHNFSVTYEEHLLNNCP